MTTLLKDQRDNADINLTKTQKDNLDFKEEK